MRGSDQGEGSMFSYVDLERRIPRSHPLRRIRSLMDEDIGTTLFFLFFELQIMKPDLSLDPTQVRVLGARTHVA